MGMRTNHTALVAGTLAGLLALGATPALSARSPKRRPPPPVVIAVVETGGLNVLHQDFGAGGRTVRLPSGMPAAEKITLPSTGSFDERLAKAGRGPLGSLPPGLYRVAGTRIVGVYVPPGSEPVDLLADRVHATGTTSSAVGLKHGTNPEALLVFVPVATSEAWKWVADQEWIDVVSTSYYTLVQSGSDAPTCPARAAIGDIVASGRLVFSSAGNAEQAGPAFAPSGVPEAYQVGGVDENGFTYVPDPQDQEPSITPTRPYETGDRFAFPAADPDSLDGSVPFGGTSGATPSTAGRAAELIGFARRLLGGGAAKRVLATSRQGVQPPPSGPLADGDLSSSELIEVLHNTAIPALPAFPTRYLVEGYGAVNAQSIAAAKRVLAGKEPLPERPDDDMVHAQVEQLRGSFFPPVRCD
jgi:hypothetical protein